MRLLRILLICYCFSLGYSTLANTSDQLLEAAKQVYQEGDYVSAAKTYESLLAAYPYSADIHFNLGNAYFRTNQFGKAVLHLERAALYSPRDKDIQYNLEVVRSRLEDQLEMLPDFFITRWWNGLRATLSPTGWGIIGLLFLWAGIAGLLIWQRGQQRKLRKQGFVIGIILILLSVIPFSLGYDAQGYMKNPGRAVILESEVKLRSAPDQASENLFLLHEGTSMEVLDQIGEWYKIRLPNGEEGWLKAESIELV